MTVSLAWILLAVVVAGAPEDEPSSRETLVRIAVAEDARRFDSDAFAAGLSDSRAASRSCAALALSRLQDPRGVALLVPLLEDEDPDVRQDAVFALGQIGDPRGAGPLRAVLEEGAPDERAEAAVALGRIGGSTDLLAARARAEMSTPVRRALALGLFHDPDPGAVAPLVVLASDPEAAVRFAAVYGLVRRDASAAAAALRRLVADPTGPAGWDRVFAARGLGDLDDAASAVPVLLEALARERARRGSGEPGDPLPVAMRAEALGALADHASDLPAGTVASLRPLLLREEPFAVVRIRAVELFERLARDGVPEAGEARRTLALAAFVDPSRWVRAEAAGALGATAEPLELAAIVAHALRTEEPLVREAVARGLAGRAPERAIESLRLLFDAGGIRTQTAVVQALKRFSGRAAAVDLVREALRVDDLAVRGAAVSVLGAWGDPGFVRELRAAHAVSDRFELAEVRAQAVTALADLVAEAGEAFFRAALEDPEPMVRRRAAAALEARGAGPVPLERIQASRPAPRELLEPLGETPRVQVVTDRGAFEIELFPEAPLLARDFLARVDGGFYRGLTFHRVVPNFVVQGGDPRGDGWGGLPDRFVREQWSRRRFETGTVGMPTAGKDTGGCQLFVTLCPTPHLDGRYTAFGRVVSGMDVVLRIEKDDRILDATRVP